MDAARTRIGRIKLKAGGEIRLLEQPTVDAAVARARRGVLGALDKVSPDRRVAGYVFVVWDERNYCLHRAWIGPNSRVPRLLAPEFVRNLMLSEAIEDYAEDRIMWKLGYGPDPAS